MTRGRITYGQVSAGGVTFSCTGGRFVILSEINGRWAVLDRTDNLGDALGSLRLRGESLGARQVAAVTVRQGFAGGWAHGLVTVPGDTESGQPGVDAKTPVPGEHP